MVLFKIIVISKQRYINKCINVLKITAFIFAFCRTFINHHDPSLGPIHCSIFILPFLWHKLVLDLIERLKQAMGGDFARPEISELRLLYHSIVGFGEGLCTLGKGVLEELTGWGCRRKGPKRGINIF